MIKLSRLFHYKLTVHIAVLQPHICRNIYGLGYSLFARRYWGNHFCFLFLWLLRCFSSPGWLQMMTSLQLAGFPHSGIVGSKLVHQLANAFRRSLRPSSPLIAKAFTMCAYSLDHITLSPLRHDICIFQKLHSFLLYYIFSFSSI